MDAGPQKLSSPGCSGDAPCPGRLPGTCPPAPGISVLQPGLLSLLPGDRMVLTPGGAASYSFLSFPCHLRVHCSPECMPRSPPVRSLCMSVSTSGGREDRAPRGRGGMDGCPPGCQGLSFPKETPWECLSPELEAGTFPSLLESALSPTRLRVGPGPALSHLSWPQFPIVPGGVGHGTA